MRLNPQKKFAHFRKPFFFCNQLKTFVTLNKKVIASTSETGHAVNLNNFNIIINRCTSYTTRYNPTNNLLKIPALQTVYITGTTALQNIALLKHAWQNAINLRQQIFFEMEKLATLVINAFDATEAVTNAQVKDAKTIIRKIRGERKSKKNLNPGPDDPAQISVSQQSYANQIMHFAELIGLLAAEPTYKPNETELQTANLGIFITDLNSANQKVITTQQPYLDALTERSTILFTPKPSLLDLALEVKRYVKSVQTITPAEYKQISGLKFSRPRK